MQCAVLGVGVFGPGLATWPQARAVLRGEAPYVHGEAAVPPATLLPPAERRRATTTTRLALTAAQEALAHAGIDAGAVPVVFASSSGSADIIHDICSMLAAGDYQISPTKFHNSVHNAASGYYSIAVGSQRGASSICAYDGSAAAGLLEAIVQVIDGGAPVLLVSFDAPYPFPLSNARRIRDAWAAGLLLGVADAPSSLAGLTVRVDAAAADGTVAQETMLDLPALEAARAHNPTARLLPLLAAIARGGERECRSVVLHQGNGAALHIELE